MFEKTNRLALVWDFGFRSFVLVWDFVLRISDCSCPVFLARNMNRMRDAVNSYARPALF